MDIRKQVLLVHHEGNANYSPYREKGIPKDSIPSGKADIQTWLDAGWIIVSATDRTILLAKSYIFPP